MKEGALQFMSSQERPEENGTDYAERQKQTVPEILRDFKDEERVGYIQFLLEEKESAQEIESVLKQLREVVGEEKAGEIVEKAKARIKNSTEEVTEES